MFERNLPDEYRSREATFEAWAAHGYEPEIVKQVLGILSRAFGWSTTDGLRLRPDDQVWGIYYHYYPGWNPRVTGWRRWIGSGSDELEMETILTALKNAVPPSRTVDLHPAVTVAELVKLLEG